MLLLEYFQLLWEENEVECDMLPVKKVRTSETRTMKGGITNFTHHNSRYIWCTIDALVTKQKKWEKIL